MKLNYTGTALPQYFVAQQPIKSNAYKWKGLVSQIPFEPSIAFQEKNTSRGFGKEKKKERYWTLFKNMKQTNNICIPNVLFTTFFLKSSY